MLRLAAVVLCAAVFVGAAGPGAFGELSLGTTARDHARYEAAIRHYSRVIEWPDVSKSNLGNAYYRVGKGQGYGNLLNSFQTRESLQTAIQYHQKHLHMFGNSAHQERLQ